MLGMKMLRWFATGILGLVALSACTTIRYGYYPIGHEETISAGQRGATFPVHVNESEGTLHLMSLGVVDLKSASKPDHAPALHLRMIVSNKKGTEPWTVDSRDVKVVLSSGEASIPAYVKTQTTSAPRVVIAAGEVHKLDLFYPLPKDRDEPKAFDGFDLQWKITAGGKELADHTPFIRQQTHRKLASIEVNAQRQHQDMVLDAEEMSPGYWWYDDTYPSYAFPGAHLGPML
jgi:hypothetical protein